jgi:hypothetical protein
MDLVGGTVDLDFHLSPRAQARTLALTLVAFSKWSLHQKEGSHDSEQTQTWQSGT